MAKSDRKLIFTLAEGNCWQKMKSFYHHPRRKMGAKRLFLKVGSGKLLVLACVFSEFIIQVYVHEEHKANSAAGEQGLVEFSFTPGPSASRI